MYLKNTSSPNDEFSITDLIEYSDDISGTNYLSKIQDQAINDDYFLLVGALSVHSGTFTLVVTRTSNV